MVVFRLPARFPAPAPDPSRRPPVPEPRLAVRLANVVALVAPPVTSGIRAASGVCVTVGNADIFVAGPDSTRIDGADDGTGIAATMDANVAPKSLADGGRLGLANGNTSAFCGVAVGS